MGSTDGIMPPARNYLKWTVILWYFVNQGQSRTREKYAMNNDEAERLFLNPKAGLCPLTKRVMCCRRCCSRCPGAAQPRHAGSGSLACPSPAPASSSNSLCHQSQIWGFSPPVLTGGSSRAALMLFRVPVNPYFYVTVPCSPVVGNTALCV